jgi:hypothetical protein
MKRRALLTFGLAAAIAPLALAQDQTLPAPMPRDVSVRIGASAAGRSIEVPVESRFAVELIGIPTAGYVWRPVQMPAFLTRAGEASGPTIAAQTQPGFVGGRHWEVLMFSALEEGTGELVLAQIRPSAPGEAAATFRVTIVAR